MADDDEPNGSAINASSGKSDNDADSIPIRLNKLRFAMLDDEVDAGEDDFNVEPLKRNNSLEAIQTAAGRRKSMAVDRRKSVAAERRKSLAAAVRKIGCLPQEPVYGDDWNLKFQPAGSVQYMHWTQQGSDIEITSFSPGLDGKKQAPKYMKKTCKYSLDATPEEAEFVAPEHHLLPSWKATAMCGNEITATINFSVGLVCNAAGYLAPLCLLIVFALLFFFRNIYTEVVTALPLNGGTYTAMLNITKKSYATISACLAFLAYTATVVVCAASAILYLEVVWPNIYIVGGTIAIVCLIAGLALAGVKENPFVAVAIFSIHMVTLAILVGCSIAFAVDNGGKNILDHYRDRPAPENIGKALVLGFALGMLCIPGYESSANFVEHQRPGVYSKTLRNMWIAVSLINPTVCFLSFAVIPYDRFYEIGPKNLQCSHRDSLNMSHHGGAIHNTSGSLHHGSMHHDVHGRSAEHSSDLLTSTLATQSGELLATTLSHISDHVATVLAGASVHEGGHSSEPSEKEEEIKVCRDVVDTMLAIMAIQMKGFVHGPWLLYLVIADSVLILCGSLLSAFVACQALLTRMVEDDIFPRGWKATTPKTGSQYPIILFFLAASIGLVVLTDGVMDNMGGVFVINFLVVSIMFCLCNLIMKHTRRHLKREARSNWYVVLMCMAGLVISLVGNCIDEPIIIAYATLFIFIIMTMFYCMSARTFLIRGFLNVTERLEAHSRGQLLRKLRQYLVDVLYRIEQLPVVFFSRNLDIREMNLAVQRVLSDELTRRLIFVHFYENLDEIPENFNYERLVLDTQMFPNIQLDAILIKGHFGPGAVRMTQSILDISPNRMFISAPSSRFPYNIAQLGSVRIILDREDDDDDSDDDYDDLDMGAIGMFNQAFTMDNGNTITPKASNAADPERGIPLRNRYFSMAVPNAAYMTANTLTGTGGFGGKMQPKLSTAGRKISSQPGAKASRKTSGPAAFSAEKGSKPSTGRRPSASTGRRPSVAPSAPTISETDESEHLATAPPGSDGARRPSILRAPTGPPIDPSQLELPKPPESSPKANTHTKPTERSPPPAKKKSSLKVAIALSPKSATKHPKKKTARFADGNESPTAPKKLPAAKVAPIAQLAETEANETMVDETSLKAEPRKAKKQIKFAAADSDEEIAEAAVAERHMKRRGTRFVPPSSNPDDDDEDNIEADPDGRKYQEEIQKKKSNKQARFAEPPSDDEKEPDVPKASAAQKNRRGTCFVPRVIEDEDDDDEDENQTAENSESVESRPAIAGSKAQKLKKKARFAGEESDKKEEAAAEISPVHELHKKRRGTCFVPRKQDPEEDEDEEDSDENAAESRVSSKCTESASVHPVAGTSEAVASEDEDHQDEQTTRKANKKHARFGQVASDEDEEETELPPAGAAKHMKRRGTRFVPKTSVEEDDDDNEDKAT